MPRSQLAVAPASAATESAAVPMQERAYRLLRQMIGDGRVRPGERLQEVQVARAFGVSRSPARDLFECAARRAELGQDELLGRSRCERLSGSLQRLARVID